jgi:hypothetical protein
MLSVTLQSTLHIRLPFGDAPRLQPHWNEAARQYISLVAIVDTTGDAALNLNALYQ